MKKRLLAIVLTGLVTVNLLAGCSSMSKATIIPSDIINKAVSLYEKPKSYYSEATMVMYENNQLKDKSTMKEWADNSTNIIKRRIEMSSDTSGEIITTNDGKQMLMYMKKENKAMRMNAEVGLDSEFNNYKKQMFTMLGGISETHDVTYKGEEDIGGFKTYHLEATPKQKNNIFGEMNFWVDGNSWFVVKMTTESVNDKMEVQYTKLDFSPKLDSSLFVQDIPSDIEIEDLDSMKSPYEEIDLVKAEKIAGKPILTMKEDNGYKLKNVTFMDFTDHKEINHKEINQTYEKNGAEALVLSTIIYNDGKALVDQSDLKIGDEKEVLIRGKKVTVMEAPIKMFSWSEDGFNYSLLIQDPTMTVENGTKLVEGLQHNQ